MYSAVSLIAICMPIMLMVSHIFSVANRFVYDVHWVCVLCGISDSFPALSRSHSHNFWSSPKKNFIYFKTDWARKNKALIRRIILLTMPTQPKHSLMVKKKIIIVVKKQAATIYNTMQKSVTRVCRLFISIALVS